jgi:hypothetical protein
MEGQRLLEEEQAEEIAQVMEEVMEKWYLPDAALDDLYMIYETGYGAGNQMEYSYPS